MSEHSSDSHELLPSIHQPVLVREVLQHLNLSPDHVVVDGTVGGGGHSQLLLKQLGESGRLIGLDRDEMMLRFAAQKLSDSRCQLVHSSYARLPDILTEANIGPVDRVLLDLGLSSDQLADRRRGFGFDSGGPLDLRFDVTSGQPAAELLASSEEEELRRIFEDWGEDRFSAEVAHAVVRQRKFQPIETAEQFVEVIESAIPARFQKTARKNPATRFFQALRIAVNEELTHLEHALKHALPDALKPGGRAVILTFHSLEDRLVKQLFRDDTLWHTLTPKPITATPSEQRINPRSRSAKLRAASRI